MLNFSKFPIFNTGNKNGYTDYIDYLKWYEITHSIMTGKDMFGRQFIVIKMIIDKNKIMQTFFERHQNLYTNKWGYSGWMGCGHATQLLFDTCGGMTKSQYKFIEELVNNKSATITEDINPCNKKNIGKKVYIFDEKRWNAAKLIQKNWKIVRYDPKYKMCERVLNRNMDEIYGL